MKHNILNCYIDGKKSAIAIVENVFYLFSHSQDWNNTRLNNMLGWKFAYTLGQSGTIRNANDLGPVDIVNLLKTRANIDVSKVVVEGSDEYAEIRANIRKCPGRTRTPKRTPETETTPEPVPVPEPVPAPAPDPVPAPAPKPKKDSGEVYHARYNDVLTLLNCGSSVYLYGPAGSGKNHVCEQLARALGLEFYYQNSITDEYKLIGFIDGAGNYHETEFYRAFTKGGLFMLDEMDASCPDTLVTLNAALANGYFTFPCGRVKMHPDFHCVSAGNTCGRGATEEYNGRMQLDAASLNRFVPVSFDYCPAVEKKLAGPDGAEVLEFIRDLRKSAKRAGVHIVLGYRNIQRLATFAKVFDAKRAVEYAVTGGYDTDEINILRAGLTNKNNRFALAM